MQALKNQIETAPPLRNERARTATHPAWCTVSDAAARAMKAIAPLWPLKHFVAVNPFLGLADRTFLEGARIMAETAGARMTMPRDFYRQAMAEGRMTDDDLAAALADFAAHEALPCDANALRALLESAPGDEQHLAALPTVADVAAQLSGKDWARSATERIGWWAAAHFDAGQATWPSPWRSLDAYTAWREEALIDRTPEVMGIKRFRAFVRSLPESPEEVIAAGAALLDIPERALHTYFLRLLMSIGGWAGYARYLQWQAELNGGTDKTLLHLLAVRVAWDLALYEAYAQAGLTAAWAEAATKYDPGKGASAAAEALLLDVVLQQAFEHGWQRQLITRVNQGANTSPEPGAARPTVQAAFCIDVRSEVFRRAFESVAPRAETLGFAGFFGLPIEFKRLGESHGTAHCPVLLKPKYVIEETIAGADVEAAKKYATKRTVALRMKQAWKGFKYAAVSSFGFVETVGLTAAAKLVTDSLGHTRPVPHPSAAGLPEGVRRRRAPSLTPSGEGECRTGLATAERVAVAEAILRAMSLTDGFAPLVLLVGHGATVVNNPHATGLDCGACGGHAGDANARAVAAILNDPDVRAGIAASGINIPADTVFLGCLHDTTTDEVTVFDADAVPPGLQPQLAEAQAQLAAAAAVARAERAPRLGVTSGNTDAEVIARSRDWSQVRPEWGLAGCSAFVVAPRRRTQGVNLEGRSFLHSYDWRKDDGFGVLELIMTAPMVVTSWINLQYYGSAVDNRVFGAGNKTLHNVVGALGVLEGNGGDLRTGLPWQSVHDGERLVHEPLRLNVIIEAPVEAINGVIAKHQSVRNLVDNGWIHLFAMDSEGRVAQRYVGDLVWDDVVKVETLK